DERVGIGPLTSLRAAHRHGLDVLRAEYGAGTAAAGVPAVVRDRRVADAALPRRPDRCNPEIGTEPGPHLLLGHRTRVAAQVLRGLEPDLAIVDHDQRERARTPDDDDGVAAAAFAREHEAAAGQ